MTSLEMCAHAVLLQMDDEHKEHFLGFVIDGRLTQVGYGVLSSRDLIREDEYGSTVLSDLGVELRKLVDNGKV